MGLVPLFLLESSPLDLLRTPVSPQEVCLPGERMTCFSWIDINLSAQDPSVQTLENHCINKGL